MIIIMKCPASGGTDFRFPVAKCGALEADLVAFCLHAMVRRQG